jgi:hypothetical protein
MVNKPAKIKEAKRDVNNAGNKTPGTNIISKM